MMRTIEVLLVIAILLGAFAVVSSFAVLPLPREVAPLNLRRLALTTLQTLDSNNDLSKAAFDVDNDTTWNHLQVALSAMLPTGLIYNLTILEVNSDASGTELYTSVKSISNAENLGSASDASQYFVASSNVTFNVTPQKIGENGNGGTLYILNCSDANGWWITGYTAQSLAQDLYNLLSPYFTKTIMVQNTTQLGQILGNTSLQGETVQNAVIINTFGESVPIPQVYTQGYALKNEGYNSSVAYQYTRYCYTLGNKTRSYNWTWASIVGYPLYYASNTVVFANENNTYGIYGMRMVYRGGINAFLQGLDGQPFVYNDGGITQSSNNPVNLLSNVLYYCNYYGIYPSPSQTSTRALSTSILNSYHLNLGLDMFSRFDSNYIPGAVYRHVSGGSTNVTGSLLALGLTRSPDIRITALGILSYYTPRLYRSEYTANGTSRLVVLQLGLVGGV
jgi:hypothetical protein